VVARAGAGAMGCCGSVGDREVEVVEVGVDECRGTFRPNGAWDGAPQWVNDAGVELWRADSEWRMGRANDFYYVGAEGTRGMSAEDMLTRGFWVKCTYEGRANVATCDPAPRIVVHAKCCCC